MATWATEEQVLDFLAGVLGKPSSEELPAFWAMLAPVFLENAETLLRSALANRGYTAAQVATVAGAGSLVVQQATVLCAYAGLAHLGEEFEFDGIEALDMREAWADPTKTIPVVLDGLTGQPAKPALCGFGSLRNNSEFTSRNGVTARGRGEEEWRRY